MADRVSARDAQRTAKADEKQALKQVRDAAGAGAGGPKRGGVAPVADSFQNLAQNLGVGADNPLSTAGYGFNPISRQRVTLEWIHRGSWLGGMAVDVIADDMTRGGVTILGTTPPDKIKEVEAEAVRLGIWESIGDTIRWGRLYGGAIGVLRIDGQEEHTPFDVERVGKDSFKGITVFDRWMVEPTMSDLVTEPGPHEGTPKFYTVRADAHSMRGKRIHHSRCIRIIGVKLPYWQAVIEQLWGASILERLWDRMVAFDSASTGAAQLVYKAWLRTIKIKGFRNIVAAGNKPLQGLIAQIHMMRRMSNIEGIAILDGDDEYEGMETTAFSGLDATMTQFAQQMSGALGVPLIRLYGQTPGGLAASGESDLRTYYDKLKSDQERDLTHDVTTIYQALHYSKVGKPPKGFGVAFNSLWQMTPKEKAEVAEIKGRTVGQAFTDGILPNRGVALQELQQQARETGVFSNITSEHIKAGEDEEVPPPGAEMALQEEQARAAAAAGAQPPPGGKPGAPGQPVKKKPAVKDAIPDAAWWKQEHNIDVVIENTKGSIRRGQNWEAVLPDDYGYIRATEGADGEQVDCFVGGGRRVFVIWQNDLQTGSFDEHKVMLGYDSLAEALGTYASAYSDGRGLDRVGRADHMPVEAFKKWLKEYVVE